MANKRKYVESHWLVYAFQGLISLLFGWFIMFTGISDTFSLIAVIGTTLLGLGIIETINMLYRKRGGDFVILSMLLAISEIAIALALLFTINQNVAWHLIIVAVYTIGRGVLELILAFRSITDKTDKFMWAVCGICGCIIGFVILNSGSFTDSITFIRFFGTYMMVYGVTNLIYGIHNKNEREEEKEARAKARKEKKATRLFKKR